MNNWKRIVVAPDVTVIDAMKLIDSLGTQFVMVLDSEDTLLGVVTDGDIRRGILNNIPLTSPVNMIMNTTPRTLSSDVSKVDAVAFLQANHITHVPLVNSKGKVKSVVSIDERTSLSGNPSTVVLMVGGLGSRLGQLTSNCPKPMLQIGGKPVLEVIVSNLKEHGFTDFIFCVNYMADMIIEHFGDGSSLGVKIRYVHESKRMGTAGALTLLPDDISPTMLVMNGDIVTKVNFSGLMDFHREHKAVATMAVRKYDFQIPYGVVKTEDGKITGIEEKPNHTFLVSAGIYVVEKSTMKYLPRGEYFDMPHFFEAMLKQGDTTQAFPIHEYWLDIGREDDLIKAQQEFTSERQ
jgi:dTDP-glucose pyrophosphorylase